MEEAETMMSSNRRETWLHRGFKVDFASKSRGKRRVLKVTSRKNKPSWSRVMHSHKIQSNRWWSKHVKQVAQRNESTKMFQRVWDIKSWEPDEGGSREQTSSRAVTHTWKLWKASRKEMEPLRPPSDTGEPQQPIRAESRLMRMMKTQICLSFYSDVSRKRLPSVPPAPASSISSLLSRCCCLSHSAAKNGAVHCSSHLKPFSSCFTFTYFDQDLQVLLTCINVKELYNLEKLNKLNSSWWRWDGRTF